MAHIHEKIDWTVTVFIVHKLRVLIRYNNNYNLWLGVGGHIELDEDPIQAGKRECMEEVGLDVSMAGETEYISDTEGRLNIPPPQFMNRHNVDKIHEHIDSIYFGTSESNVVIPEKETDSWHWLTRVEVLEHPEISETIKKYAVAALDFYA